MNVPTEMDIRFKVNIHRRYCASRFIGLPLILLVAQAVAAPKTPRQEIQAQYDRWSIAYVANDVPTLLSILDPSFTLTNIDKDTMSYKTYSAYLGLRKGIPKESTKYKTEVRQIKMVGKEALVNATEFMSTEKKSFKTGKMQIAIHTHEYLDTWVFVKPAWRLKKTVTLKESTTIKEK